MPQGRRIFGSLTVRENLDMAARRQVPAGRRRWTRDEVCDIFPRLRERQQQVGVQPVGRRAADAGDRPCADDAVRALLLLDEPSEGLAPQIVHEVQQVLERLKGELTIVLVEQNLGLAMALADDVVLLDTGRVVPRQRSACLRGAAARVAGPPGLA